MSHLSRKKEQISGENWKGSEVLTYSNEEFCMDSVKLNKKNFVGQSHKDATI